MKMRGGGEIGVRAGPKMEAKDRGKKGKKEEVETRERCVLNGRFGVHNDATSAASTGAHCH